jgi:protease I
MPKCGHSGGGEQPSPKPMAVAPQSSRKPIKVAILVTDGFEQSELTGPRGALWKNGFVTEIVSPKGRKVSAVVHGRPGATFSVDIPLDEAKPADFDALLLPGGVMNPDALRMEPAAVRFVQSFFKAGKPVAAICHGPVMLIEAGVVKGRNLTSFPSIQTDLRNAGAKWTNQKVVVDVNLITSRKPSDIPAFNAELIRALVALRDV